MGSSVSAAVKAYSNKKIAQPQAETAQQVDVVEPTMAWSRLSTVDLSPATRGIQAKLNISRPDDPLEKEADEVADRVMRMPNAGHRHSVTASNSGSQQIFRKCAGCGKTISASTGRCPGCGDEIQRKSDSAGNRSNLHGPISPTIRNLDGGGRSMSPAELSFYGGRFGADFSAVRVHDNNESHQMSQAINARAFTLGDDIAFARGERSATHEGQKLFAHELAHTLQQGTGGSRTNGSKGSVHRRTVYRQPNKGTGSSKADEAALISKFKAIEISASNISPSDKKAKKKLRAGIKEFLKGFANYKPTRSSVGAFGGGMLPPGVGYDDWRGANIFSRYEANILAARLRLIGLDMESDRFYAFAKSNATVGVYKYNRPDTYFKEYTKLALESVKLGSQAEMDASLDLLIKSFLYIVDDISKLDVAQLKRDEKITSPIFPAGGNRGELGWMGIWRFYLAQLHRLGQIFAGMQRIVQANMDQLFKELNTTGEAPTIVELIKTLKKIAKSIPEQQAFQSKVPADVRKKYGLPASGAIKFFPTGVDVAVTRSTFTKKGGQHLDVFDKSAGAASVDIEYYDREKESGDEKYLPIVMVDQARWRQIEFIKNFYGLNDKGRRIKSKQSPMDLMGGQFSLFSLDDWRQYAYKKYDDLVNKQKASKADAFLTVIRELRSYVQAFTIATPYNIAETGTNYLTRPFPRALTGQLVQDCGVYALKTIYMLSLLAEKINLKIQHVILPNHVGLIIKGDNTPLVIVHNNSFTPFALSESQFDGLSRQNQRMILSQGSLDRYLKARKQKNTQKFAFTLDKMKQSWTNATAQMGIPGPVTDKQFQGELAANYFVSNVDMPFTLRDVNSSLYQSSQSTGSTKRKLWKDYQAMVNSGKLFNDKAIAEEFTPNYQFNLRYLKLTQLDKKFHNEILVPYWNGKAHTQWRKLVKELKAASTAGDIKRYIEILTDYRQAFNTGSKGVISKYQFIQDEKDRIHRAIDANQPGPLKSGVGRTFGARGFGNVWKHAFNTHLRTLDERLAGLRNNKQTLAKGTDITPAFANRGDLLKRQP